MSRKTAQYGTWESPISVDLLTADTVGLLAVKVHRASGDIFWLEQRPDGREKIVRRTKDGRVSEVLPTERSALTSIHEYGGASFSVNNEGGIIFQESPSQKTFLLDPTTGKCTLIFDDRAHRLGDFEPHPNRHGIYLAVEEDHSDPSAVINSLVTLDVVGKVRRPLMGGADFYTSPRFSPNGEKFCWLQWDHPDMPWTGGQLFVSSWHDSGAGERKLVAGKAGAESVSQPRWAPDGALLFAFNRSGYWQLFRLPHGAREPEYIRLEGLTDADMSEPEWQLGLCTFVPITADRVVASFIRNASTFLVDIDIPTRSWKPIDFPLVGVSPTTAMAALSEHEVLIIGAKADVPASLYLFDLDSPSTPNLLKSSNPETGPLSTYFSSPEHITIPVGPPDPATPSPSGCPASEPTKTHVLFFAPKNPHFTAPPDSQPPLILEGHGGPTSHWSPGLDLNVQYWTSRGYAVALLNYRGSSGYGNAYRAALDGRWGAIDVTDAAAAVGFLARAGRADAARVGVRGGSAGGYLVLQGLVRRAAVWAGGVSYYGIGDLAGLVRETHKFESRYLDGLLFAPGMGHDARQARLFERSPVHFADRIEAPVLLLQGSEDRVVPPGQAVEMERRIAEKGGVCRRVVFEGEGHGFTKGTSKKTAIEEEERWWRMSLVRDQGGDESMRAS